MARPVLPTDFKDDVLAESMAGKRRYRIIQNVDGTVSLDDVTDYEQVGSTFGAKQVNDMSSAVNSIEDVKAANNCTTTEPGFVLDARQGKTLMDKSNELSRDLQVGGVGGMTIGSMVTTIYNWVQKNSGNNLIAVKTNLPLTSDQTINLSSYEGYQNFIIGKNIFINVVRFESVEQGGDHHFRATRTVTYEPSSGTLKIPSCYDVGDNRKNYAVVNVYVLK